MKLNRSQINALAWELYSGGGTAGSDVGDTLSTINDFYSHYELSETDKSKVANRVAEIGNAIHQKAQQLMKKHFEGRRTF